MLSKQGKVGQLKMTKLILTVDKTEDSHNSSLKIQEYELGVLLLPGAFQTILFYC